MTVMTSIMTIVLADDDDDDDSGQRVTHINCRPASLNYRVSCMTFTTRSYSQWQLQRSTCVQNLAQIVARHRHHQLVYLRPPSRDQHNYRSRDTRCPASRPISASRWRHDRHFRYICVGLRSRLCKTPTFHLSHARVSLMDFTSA